MENRYVLSFYKLCIINDRLPPLRNNLFDFFKSFNVLGRVYVASDGLNAQISIPESVCDAFKDKFVKEFPVFHSVFFNQSTSFGNFAFSKLKVKIRPQIVADDIQLHDLNVHLTPESLKPRPFHDALVDHIANPSKAIMLDIRNQYELEIGRFPCTDTISAETFRDYMRQLRGHLLSKCDPSSTHVLMVCTGGIRCSKAGLVMRNWGWHNVKMLHGGITNYARDIPSSQSLFSGTNYTFDHRNGESGNNSNTRISRCSCCGELAQTVSNCTNDSCNRLIVQCERCKSNLMGTCGPGCHQIYSNAHLHDLLRGIGSAASKHSRGIA